MPEADEIVARVLTWVANQCANRIRISVHNLRLTRRRTRAKIQRMDPEAIAAMAAGAVGAFTAIGVWGAFVPSSQLFGPTRRRTGDSGAIALTFDDGPNPT